MSSLRRVLGVARKTVSVLRHDKRTVAFIVLVPLMIIVIFGYTFGGEPKDITLVVVMEDTFTPEMARAVNPSLNGTEVPPLGELIVEHLDTDYFDITFLNDEDAAREMVRNGEAWAALIIPKNFSAGVVVSMGLGGNESLELVMDGTDVQISGVVVKEVNSATVAGLEEWMELLGLPEHEIPVSVARDYVYGGEDVRFVDNLAPGIIGYAVMMVSLMITLVTLVRERNDGTLERAASTPLAPFEVVLGNALAFSLVALVQSLVIFSVAVLLFDIAVMGSVALALFIILLHAVGHQAMGMLLSSAARNELQAVQLFPLVVFPAILLTGMLWPLEAIPAFLRPLSYLVPLTYTNDALKGVMLRGWGVGDVWFDLLVMTGFATVMLLGAALVLSRKR